MPLIHGIERARSAALQIWSAVVDLASLRGFEMDASLLDELNIEASRRPTRLIGIAAAASLVVGIAIQGLSMSATASGAVFLAILFALVYIAAYGIQARQGHAVSLEGFMVVASIPVFGPSWEVPAAAMVATLLAQRKLPWPCGAFNSGSLAAEYWSACLVWHLLGPIAPFEVTIIAMRVGSSLSNLVLAVVTPLLRGTTYLGRLIGMAAHVARNLPLDGLILVVFASAMLQSPVVVLMGIGALLYVISAATKVEETVVVQNHQLRVDPLTGVLNRRGFDELAAQVVAKARNADKPVAMLLGDLDHFKQCNDVYGHATGDQVLQLAAQSISGVVDRFDGAGVGRYGGEEFVVVLPNQDQEAVLAIAEQIRAGVQQAVGTYDCSISIGVTMAQVEDETAAALCKQADDAMYVAKEQGRNRVVLHGDLGWRLRQATTSAVAALDDLDAVGALSCLQQFRASVQGDLPEELVESFKQHEATALLARGQVDGALSSMLEAIGEEPLAGGPAARMTFGLVALELGGLDDATAMFDSVVEAPDRSVHALRAEAYVGLARVAASSGQMRSAFTHLAEARACGHAHGGLDVALLWSARLARQQGDTELLRAVGLEREGWTARTARERLIDAELQAACAAAAGTPIPVDAVNVHERWSAAGFPLEAAYAAGDDPGAAIVARSA